MNSYSRYVDLPVDRDLERIHDDLRALPTPAVDAPAGHGQRLHSWLRRRRNPSTGMPLGRLHRA